MKFTADRPYSDSEKAACKLLEIANSVEAVQDGRIYIELINSPFLFREKGTSDEVGLDLATGVLLTTYMPSCANRAHGVRRDDLSHGGIRSTGVR